MPLCYTHSEPPDAPGVDHNIKTLHSSLQDGLLACSGIQPTSELWGYYLPLQVRHVESVGALRENLNAIGLIATFLAAVQTQAISFTVQNNNTTLQSAVNAFFFAGMFLDVVGGCIAFIAVVQFQKLYALLVRRTKSVSAIMDALEKRIGPSFPTCDSCQTLSFLRHYYQFLEVRFQSFLGNVSAWESELSPLKGLAGIVSDVLRDLDGQLHAAVHPHIVEYMKTGVELSELRLATSIAYAASVAVPLIVGTGATCFILGGLCFVKGAQPIGVQVTSFVVVFGTILLFGAAVRNVSRTRK